MDAEEAEEAAEAGEDYVLLARMGAGLFTLQQCALIMGHLWFVGDLGVRKRILLLLHQQARSHSPDALIVIFPGSYCLGQFPTPFAVCVTAAWSLQ